MIEFDVADHRVIGEIVQEFRAFVEKGRIVFVPLDHKVLTTPETETGLKVLRDTSYEKIRRPSCGMQSPGDHCGCRGLAVRSGDDDRGFLSQKEVLERFRKRCHVKPRVES